MASVKRLKYFIKDTDWWKLIFDLEQSDYALKTEVYEFLSKSPALRQRLNKHKARLDKCLWRSQTCMRPSRTLLHYFGTARREICFKNVFMCYTTRHRLLQVGNRLSRLGLSTHLQNYSCLWAPSSFATARRHYWSFSTIDDFTTHEILKNHLLVWSRKCSMVHLVVCNQQHLASIRELGTWRRLFKMAANVHIMSNAYRHTALFVQDGGFM